MSGQKSKWESVDTNQWSALSLLQAIAVLKQAPRVGTPQLGSDGAAPASSSSPAEGLTPIQEAYRQALHERYSRSVAAKRDPHVIESWNETGVARVEWDTVKAEAERKIQEIEAERQRQKELEKEQEEEEEEGGDEEEDEEEESSKQQGEDETTQEEQNEAKAEETTLEEEAQEEEEEQSKYDPWENIRHLFENVPLILSENIDLAGLNTSAGCEALKGHRPVRNSALAQSLINCGADILGKGSIHGLMLGFTCNHTSTGPIRNPFSQHGISGGSQGGIAAAVSSRVVPAGIGVDSVGDVRIPASLCGIIGFRPTSGKISKRGILHPSHTLDSVSLVGRKVQDLRMLYLLLSSPAAFLVSRPSMILPPAPVKKKRKGENEEDEEEEAEEEEEEEQKPSKKRRPQDILPDGDIGSKLRSALDEADRLRESRIQKQAVAAKSLVADEEIQTIYDKCLKRTVFSPQHPRALDSREQQQHEKNVKAIQEAVDRSSESRFVDTLLKKLSLDSTGGNSSPQQGDSALDGKRIGFPIKHSEVDSSVSQVISEFKKKLATAGASLVIEDFPKVEIPKRVWRIYQGDDEEEYSDLDGVVRVDFCEACAATTDVIRRWEMPQQISKYIENHELTKERPYPFTTDDVYDKKGQVKPDFYARKKTEMRKPISVLDVVSSAYCSKLEQEYLTVQLDPDSAVDAESYHLAVVESRKSIAQAFHQYMQENKLEMVAYPSCVLPAVTTIGDDVAVKVGKKVQECSRTLTYTSTLAAVCGLPAITIPCGLTRTRAGAKPGEPGADRAPIGFELAGRASSDEQLLNVAEEIESLQTELADPILRSKWETTVYEY